MLKWSFLYIIIVKLNFIFSTCLNGPLLYFFMSTIVYFYSFAFIIKILLERSCNVNKFLCTQIFTKDDSFFRTSKILLVMQFDFFKAFYFFTLFSMGGGYCLEIYCRSQIYYIRLIIEEEGSSISLPPPPFFV